VFTPMGLWALLALAIPILIHLFNRSRGRLVRIGHIDLIRQARRLRVTEVKLAQWLLLLLRLGIFTLAALVLAGLARPGLESSESATAYVSPAWLRTAQPAQIDELHSRHERVFVLQAEIAPLDKDLVNEIRQTPLKTSAVRNIWPLLADRLSLEHHGGAVDVYAVDLLMQFGNSRPALPAAVNWNLAHPGTVPQSQQLPASAVVAFDTERKQDAEAFRAALSSLKAHRIPGLSWEMVATHDITAQQLNSDWLIYLSANALTAEQLAQINTPTTVLMDATGEPPKRGLQYVTLPFYPFSTFRITAPGLSLDDAQNIVTSADGIVVLQEQYFGNTRILRFNSRFNPQSSSVTQQAEFPELLLHLMLSEEQQDLAFSNARIKLAQLQQENTEQLADIPLPRHSLQSLLMFLLVLLWVTERWLSERKQREAR